jgi:hypothetical protein
MRCDLAHLNTLPGKLNDLSDCYPDIDRGLLPVIVPLVKLALKALGPTGQPQELPMKVPFLINPSLHFAWTDFRGAGQSRQSSGTLRCAERGLVDPQSTVSSG